MRKRQIKGSETIENKSSSARGSFAFPFDIRSTGLLMALCIFFLLSQPIFADQPNFTDLGAITNNSNADEGVQIVTDGQGNWVAVWASTQASYNVGSTQYDVGSDYDIWVSRSTDNGESWSSPRVLNTNATSDTTLGQDHVDLHPRIATDRQGHWIVVWDVNRFFRRGVGTFWDKDILVARSTNAGQSWSTPVELNSHAASDGANDDEKPDIAYGGRWLVVWQSEYNPGGNIGDDFDIMWSESLNNGVSWSNATPMANAADTCRSIGWIAQQIDDTNPHVVYRGSYSNNVGPPPWILQPGAFLVTWDAPGTVDSFCDYDIVVAKYVMPLLPFQSPTWTSPVAINSNAGSDLGDDRLARVACSSGNCVAVWESTTDVDGAGTDKDVLVAHSNDGGSTWSAPTALNAYMRTDNDTMDQHPDIVTDGQGHWVAVWTSNRGNGNCIDPQPGDPVFVNLLGGDDEIFRASSSDNGSTWTCFLPVNDTPCSILPGGYCERDEDRYPTVATGQHNWVVGWQSMEGTDYEINVANVVPPTVTDIRRMDPNPTAAKSLHFEVKFNKSISGVDAEDFEVITTGNIAQATVESVTGQSATRTVTVTYSSGTGTIKLNILDDDSITNNGNSLGGWGLDNGAYKSGPIYTVGIAPTASITRLDDSPTLAATVRFRVDFSEAVTGVDVGSFTKTTQPDCFALTKTGNVSDHYISNVIKTLQNYIVTIDTGTGTGTINLKVVDDDSIKDTDTPGIPLGGWGQSDIINASTNYVVDKTAPTVGTVQSTSGSYSADNKQLEFSWFGFGEDETIYGITGYRVAFGTENNPEAYMSFTDKGMTDKILFLPTDFASHFPAGEFPESKEAGIGKYVCTVKARNAVGLESTTVSAAVILDATAYLVGQVIEPPEAKAVDWLKTKNSSTPTAHVILTEGNPKKLIIGDWGTEPITIDWWFTDGTNVERLYNTAPAAVKTPMVIYYTHGGIPVSSTRAPRVDLLNIPKVIIQYNEAVPYVEYDTQKPYERNLWKEENDRYLCARNATKDPAFVVLEYNELNGDYIGIEVVQVKPYQPDVGDGTVDIGSHLMPSNQVSNPADPVVTRGLGGDQGQLQYIYQHDVTGSPQKGQLWSVRKNAANATANMEVVWTRYGLRNVLWPYELRRYSADWPKDDPTKYQLYARGDSAGTLGPAVSIPAELNAELEDYREFVNPLHDPHLDSGLFYTDGPGWALLKYQTGNPFGRNWVGFEVVRSVLRTDLDVYDGSTVQHDIGKEITDTYHEGPLPGYIHAVEGDKYAPEIYGDTGQIFAVNKGVLEVWWSNLSRIYDPQQIADRVQWSSKVVRYNAVWPVDRDTIVIARTNGSGPIESGDYGDDWDVYFKNNANEPGFNPNDEHAFKGPYSTGKAIFALRDDLGTEDTSEPYVLMMYKKQPENQDWRFRVFKVVRADDPYVFSDWVNLSNDPCSPAYDPNHNPPSDPYEKWAGSLLQGPIQPGQLDWKGEPVSSGNSSQDHFWKDRNEDCWAVSAGHDGGTATITMRYFYKPLSSFDFPSPPSLTEDGLVAWLDDGTGVPENVTYTISWPDVPRMKVGQTVIESMYGLPGPAGNGSAEILYQQALETEGKPSIMIIDPIRIHKVTLTKLPEDIDFEDQGAEKVFPELSLALRMRVSYDPIEHELKFKGIHVDPLSGFDYALLNVMSERERDELLALSSGGDWVTAVNDLYNASSAPVEIEASSAEFDLLAYTSGYAQGAGYVTLVFNNNEDLTSPVVVQIIQLIPELDPGEIISIYPDCPFDETLTLRHRGDFGGHTEQYEFAWRFLPDEDGTWPEEPPEPNDYPIKEDYNAAVEDYWKKWIDHGDPGMGLVDTTIKGPGVKTLSDNWFICRYRCIDPTSPWYNQWSEPTEPKLAEGWIKRVMGGIGPFKQRADNAEAGIQGAETVINSYKNTSVDTIVSMISQAGPPWVGDVPMTCNNLDDFGLIEIYQTVLGRGRMLSIDNGISYPPANQALLLAAGRVADLYMLLGNEAYADAADPTIGFGTVDFGAEASSIHCFMNVTSSLLEEELALLRGRDDSKAPPVTTYPFYNRLIWNFTNAMTGGEVAYALNYNIHDTEGKINGSINEADAKELYPQGHGDAWGHYLTAIKSYYQLLRHPNYDWEARPEAVDVGGVSVTVDYLDERKFAQAAAAKARNGAEIVNLTYRNAYVEDPEGQWQGYKDPDSERAWGLSEWASRAGVGTYLDWVVGNAIIPPEDTNPNHTGIQKIDRTTILELRDVASRAQEIQAQLDTADVGLNPLGLATNVVPFDISPAEIDAGKTHFEQMYDRAVMAMNNAIAVFNHANKSTQALRQQADTLADFQRTVGDRNVDFKNRLIEIFGYPYSDDIGPGKTYPTGYDGPDLYNHMLVDPSELVGEEPAIVEISGQMKTLDVGDDGSLIETTKEVIFQLDTSANRFGLVKPKEWTGKRRAPGELQLAQSDLIQARVRFERALEEYDNLMMQIQDQADLLEAQYNLNEQEINVLNTQLDEQQRLDDLITKSRTQQLNFRKKARIATIVANALAEALPTSVGFSVDATSVGRSAIQMVGTIKSEIYTQNADRASLDELDHQQAAQAMQALTNITLTTARQEIGILQQVKQLEQLVRQEISVRLDLYTMQEAMQQASGRYMAALARGQRLLEDRLRFQMQTTSQVQEYRYKDMVFRIFRNDALQKYRAQFDLAARYVYLAAKAYDYETTFLSSDTRAGHAFLSDIVRERLIGTIVSGSPLTGSGLADPMARMSQNFEVLGPQMGFNNPQKETNRFQLRSELFRINPGSAGNALWREELWRCVVPNLLEVPEFQRYARIFQPHEAVEPGIVIPFTTNINFGMNFFGWPLGGGDNAYDSTNFTTKVRSVGVWFSNYNNLMGSGMSNTPRVYMIPVGIDFQRSPTDYSGVERPFKVLDQVLPVPFPIGGSDLEDPSWIPIIDTLMEPFGSVRRYASFRAYHDSGQFNADETIKNSRLIGRSVWNSQWLLIIPAGTLHSDRDEGLKRFIDGQLVGEKRNGNGVSDIKIFFMTYAYPGQ